MICSKNNRPALQRRNSRIVFSVVVFREFTQVFFPTVLIVGGFWFRLFSIPYGSFLLNALLFMAFSQTLWGDPAIRLSGSALFSTS